MPFDKSWQKDRQPLLKWREDFMLAKIGLLHYTASELDDLEREQIIFFEYLEEAKNREEAKQMKAHQAEWLSHMRGR